MQAAKSLCKEKSRSATFLKNGVVVGERIDSVSEVFGNSL